MWGIIRLASGIHMDKCPQILPSQFNLCVVVHRTVSGLLLSQINKRPFILCAER
jgi:hypothetical protein